MSTPADNEHEMRSEYDFSAGEKGKHFRAYREGHRVRINKENGSVEEHHFTLEDGAVMIDTDLRRDFPDSESVNKALRTLLTQK